MQGLTIPHSGVPLWWTSYPRVTQLPLLREPSVQVCRWLDGAPRVCVKTAKWFDARRLLKYPGDVFRLDSICDGDWLEEAISRLES